MTHPVPPPTIFVPRPRRTNEVFELTCYGCEQVIQIPVPVVVDDRARCPRCGTELCIKWGAR
jgi:uncharacterized paraquat-inducible protein A